MRDDEDDLQILHVDDEEEFLDLAVAHFEQIDESFDILTETDAFAALELLEEESIDCVVSDYNMPTLDGIAFLKEVRAFDQDLPFILFTGRGSEEIASDAISAGVTDYLQKKPGKERYTMLANRIKNATDRYRAMKAVEETREYYHRILEHSSDYVIIVDGNGMIDYVSPSVKRVMGYDPSDLIGTNAFEFPHPEDRDTAIQSLSSVIDNPEMEVTVEYRAQDADGEWRWIEVRGGNLLADPHIEGILVNVRDVSERKRQQKTVDNQAARFEELTAFLNHDLNNQLMLIEGYLELAEIDQSADHIAVAKRAVGRVEDAIGGIRELAKSGPDRLTVEPVDLDTVIQRSWNQLPSDGVTLTRDASLQIVADQDRLEVLLTHLLENAIQFGANSIVITAGRSNGTAWLSIDDDGPGLPVDDPADAFETGFSTSDDGAGLGLAIVNQIVESHGWKITVEGDEGVQITISEMSPAST